MKKKRKRKKRNIQKQAKIAALGILMATTIMTGWANKVGEFAFDMGREFLNGYSIKCVEYYVDSLEKISGNNTVMIGEKEMVRKGTLITTVLQNTTDKRIVIPRSYIVMDEIQKVEEPAPAIVGYFEEQKFKIFVLNNGNGVLNESILEICGKHGQEESFGLSAGEWGLILNVDEEELKINLKSLAPGEIKQVASFDIDNEIAVLNLNKHQGWINLYGEIKERNSTKQITNIWIGMLSGSSGELDFNRSYEGDGIIERVVSMKVDTKFPFSKIRSSIQRAHSCCLLRTI